MKFLLNTVKQESWQGIVRAGAITGLALLKDPRAIDVGLKYIAAGNPPAVRVASIELLSQIGKGNEKAFEMLVAALKDPSLQIQFTAIQALGSIGDARAIPALEALAKERQAAQFRQERNQLHDQPDQEREQARREKRLRATGSRSVIRYTRRVCG